MKSWIYGFFMTWGMFLALPCPYPRWDEGARGKMMVCLPFIGAIVGILWALGAWTLNVISCPAPLRAAVLGALPWCVTGFIHLDGFMDVCDAVLSRRDLAARQRILKDSHCGAFAVICLGLLMLGTWSLWLSAEEILLLPLALVPVAARAAAGFAVLTLRPMGTSQYADMERRGIRPRQTALVLIALVTCILPICLYGIRGMAPLGACLGYCFGAWRGYGQLDGMSGDISGFALTLGELAGLAVLVLVR